MDLQKILTTAQYQLLPLQLTDFDRLYAIANDPLLWAQHPNPNRYLLAEFTNYFDGAIQSNGAYIIVHKTSKEVVGCTRFYDANNDFVFIGYTFIARKHWGSGLNCIIKNTLLTHIFEYVQAVKFHVGINNIRSQKAMEKLGAVQSTILNIAYHGEPTQPNIEYIITKKEWLQQQLANNA